MKNLSCLKFVSLLFLLAIFSCERDLPVEVEETGEIVPSNGVNFDMVSLDQITRAKNYIQALIDVKTVNPHGKEKPDEVFYNEEQITKVTDTAMNVTYSVSFTFENATPNSFYNLVVTEDSSGKFMEPYVVRYKTTSEDMKVLEEHGGDFDYFKGSANLHRYTDFFKKNFNLDKNDPICPPIYDEVGDPISCERMELIHNGTSGSAGTGPGPGGTGPNNGPGCIITMRWHSCGGPNGDTTHSAAECGTPEQTGSGWIMTTTCGGETTETKLFKTDDPCERCDIAVPTSTSGPNLNLNLRAGLINNRLGKVLFPWQIEYLAKTINSSLTTAIWNFMTNNNTIEGNTLAYNAVIASVNGYKHQVIELLDYLAVNNDPLDIEFGKWAVEFISEDPTVTNQVHDYQKSLEVMEEGLREFHGVEGGLFADLIVAMIPELGNMTVAEVKDFHSLAKQITIEFNNHMYQSIGLAFAEGLVVPVIEYALFQAGSTLAIKLLQKIPISWVYRGTQLNKVITKAANLGIPGNQSFARELHGQTVGKARQYFNFLSKHKTNNPVPDADGTIVANMGSNNYITFRTISGPSSDGVIATIDLNFPQLFSQIIKLKFYP